MQNLVKKLIKNHLRRHAKLRRFWQLEIKKPKLSRSLSVKRRKKQQKLLKLVPLQWVAERKTLSLPNPNLHPVVQADAPLRKRPKDRQKGVFLKARNLGLAVFVIATCILIGYLAK